MLSTGDHHHLAALLDAVVGQPQRQRQLAFAFGIVISSMAHAQYTGGVVKIGVLSDMSSLYSDLTGAGSVAAAKLAVQDFDPASHGMKVEIVSADHQNKPDIGSNITRQWFDVDGVDVVVDVPTSSVAP
jgi:branched-chain amino acid transport system substrate-binding protein